MAVLVVRVVVLYEAVVLDEVRGRGCSKQSEQRGYFPWVLCESPVLNLLIYQYNKFTYWDLRLICMQCMHHLRLCTGRTFLSEGCASPATLLS